MSTKGNKQLNSVFVHATGKHDSGASLQWDNPVNDDTSRGVLFSIACIDKIDSIDISKDGKLLASLKPDDFTIDGNGTWKVDVSGKVSDLPRGSYLSETTNKAGEKIVRNDRREDINYALRTVLNQILPDDFGKFGAREFGGEVSADKVEYILYLFDVKKVKDVKVIGANKLVKLAPETVQKVLDNRK